MGMLIVLAISAERKIMRNSFRLHINLGTCVTYDIKVLQKSGNPTARSSLGRCTLPPIRLLRKVRLAVGAAVC